MTERDKVRFAKMLAGAQVLYMRPELDQQTSKLYWDILSIHDIEVVAYAFQQHIRDTERGQFFPKPADLIKQIPRDVAPYHGEAQLPAPPSYKDVLRDWGDGYGLRLMTAAQERYIEIRDTEGLQAARIWFYEEMDKVRRDVPSECERKVQEDMACERTRDDGTP